MLTNKEIEQISKAAIQVGAAIHIHPIITLNGIVNISPCGYDERKVIERKCRQWLFDNQQSYPFSISKEHMLQ